MADSDADADYRVLVSCPLVLDAADDYADVFDEYGIDYDIADVDQQLDEAELLDLLPDYDGILAGDDELSARVIEASPRLKAIAKWGIGTDDIDFEAAEANGVAVSNTPGAFADEVADVVIGYAIMLTRELHHVDREVRAGNWYCPRGVSLAGRTFGIVGVGSIGSAVARRAAALGMDVLGHDVEPIPEDLREETGIEPVGREHLFERSDLVSLNCALNDATAGMVDADALDRLGPEGYLVNTSRGGLVVQDDLVAALEEDRLAGAALDVFETEPLPPESPLTGMENAILGSHNAQNTAEAVARVHDRAVANLVEDLTGERPDL
ncbi:MAG: phosphoglycerate dehydrogenase [Haloarculaceae archaeon]